MPVRKAESVGQIEHNHAEKSDWEQDGNTRCEQECYPSLDQHLRVMVVDVEVFARVEVFVALQCFLARGLRGYLPTAASLIE